MNEKSGFNTKIVVVKPTPSENPTIDKINAQDSLYTLYIRGRKNGEIINEKRIISSISRCINPYKEYDKYLDLASNKNLRYIISNTTEAGISYDGTCKFADNPAINFPAKLCQFLYKRWELKLDGFIIFSLELIDHNGDELKKCVNKYIDLWDLPSDFKNWVNEENVFCSTLVDKIVTGTPKNEIEKLNTENDYIDDVIDTAESFGLWIIEGPKNIYDELPIKKSGLDDIIKIVENHVPYKERKVRILNGAHTSMVLGAYLAGFNIVRDCMNDEAIHGFMNKIIYDEVIPTLDLDKKDLTNFAEAVTDRFNNPYVDHLLLSISLNSTAKWKARVMPTLLEYAKRKGTLPKAVTMSFACYIAFYHTAKEKGENCIIGNRDIKGTKNTYEIKDDMWVLDFYLEHKNDDNKTLAHAVIYNEKMWGDALKNLKGFEETVVECLDIIDKIGIYEAMKSCV